MPSCHASRIFSLLKNPNRVRILLCLGGAELSVTALTVKTALKQPVLSHHLRHLRQAGLVTMRRDGKYHLFSVDAKAAGSFIALLSEPPSDPLPQIPFRPGLATDELVYVWNARTDEQQWYGDVDGAFGCEPGTFPRTAEAWEERVHPADLPRVLASAERHLHERVPFVERYRVRLADGSYVEWVDVGSVLSDASERPDKWIGMVREVVSSESVDGDDED